MIFRCENPEQDWINDLREAERRRDLPADWTDPELWNDDEGDDDDGS